MDLSSILTVAVVLLWFGTTAYYAVRPKALNGPLIHLTTQEGATAITEGQPPGWVHLRPGPRRRNRGFFLLGWPPRPFRRRICFFIGERWPGRFRRLYNLSHPERFTHAVVVDVGDLANHGAGGQLFRRPIDRTAVWSGSYRGPGRIVQRPSNW